MVNLVVRYGLVVVIGWSTLWGVDFSTFADMCEPTPTQSCPNRPEEVKALQHALNGDPKLFLYIRETGRWDTATKDAVVAFQEHYGIAPASGYVGRVTRAALNRLYGEKPASVPASPSAKPAPKPTSKPKPAPKKDPFADVTPTEEFILYGDMCDNTVAGNHCPNKPIEVSNLQILLNADPNLHIHIEPDGKWGQGTKNAVIAFQKHYGISPASGYVGARTKRMLDRVAGAIVAKATAGARPSKKRGSTERKTASKSPAVSVASWQDMCTPSSTDQCPNRPEDVRALQKFLGIKADGKWGRGTHAAVVRFQQKHGINPASGYVGAKTRRVIRKVLTRKRAPHTKAAIQKRKHPIKTYADFRKYTNYPRTYRVFKDTKLLAKANGRNTRIKIDVGEQRMKMYVNGKVALDSPCTTGAKRKLEPNTRTIRDKRTPLGTFRITEKIATKRSTIFGDIYRNGKKVYHGDRRKYKGSWKGAKFVGAPLKNWMRLTSSGIGIHGSRYIKRRPASNGCVRVPYTVASTVFKKVKPGTPVQVTN
jgi:peptidoglycan hydrolase-like protein with peptidoglycan-binding domain